MAQSMLQQHERHCRLRDYIILTKPEVNLLVVMTTAASYNLGCRRPLHVVGLINTIIGTLLVASGTATLNQWMERDWDGQMRRTANRPLPGRRITAKEALFLGVSLSFAGTAYLAAAVNLMAAALAISTLLSYLLIYTPLKRKTPLCTLLGAFPGAMPVLIGWTGASSKLDAGVWLLFALLVLWQFPHFLAIALMYREDYARAGYKMLPAFDSSGGFTRAQILVLTVVLVVMTLFFGISSGPISTAILALAGASFVWPVFQLALSARRKAAMGVVHASIIYLPVVLAVITQTKTPR